jgi:DNA-binding HxlR family transcriptional regulator
LKARKTADELRLCPAIGFSKIFGGKYKLRILWVLNKRPHRYGEIRTSLIKGSLSKPVTPRVLSRELKQLHGYGLIHRQQFAEVPPRVEYSLAERGRDIMPVLKAIVDWGLTGVHEEILRVARAEVIV